MKQLIYLIVLAAILMIGCQDDNSILEPTNVLTDARLLNKPNYDERVLDDYSDEDNYKVNYTKNFKVDGAKGGRLAIKHRWWDEDGEMVWLEAELFIPKDAFEGTLKFDMIFDVENLSMKLFPTPFTFDKPVEFSMGWYGLDLSEYADYDFGFNYLDGEGEQIKYFKKVVDIASGNLVIWDAQLHHFSRYGWTRVPPTIYSSR